MENISATKVSKIVAQNYRTAKVFTAHGIDFCCNGGIPLQEACALKQVDLQRVISEIEAELREPVLVDYQRMALPELIDHIVTVHHGYVERNIPLLQLYLEKLCRVHGERHPELLRIQGLFTEAANALLAHLRKEETILFPYILAMCAAHDNGAPTPVPHFGHIDNPIAMMEHEHAVEGERFRAIALLSNQYECPPDGCQTYRVAYTLLEEFEQDLHKHIHLENNVLFPRAQALFADLSQVQ